MLTLASPRPLDRAVYPLPLRLSAFGPSGRWLAPLAHPATVPPITPGVAAPCSGWPLAGARCQAVISLISAATDFATSSGGAAFIIMSLVMSPWTFTLPAMNACIPACWFPETKTSLAVA